MKIKERKEMKMKERTGKEESVRTAAIEELKKYIKPSDKIVIIVTRTARDCMSRRMLVYAPEMKFDLTKYIGLALGANVNKHGVLVKGLEFNSASRLAFEITHALWGTDENPEYKGSCGTRIDCQIIYA